MGRSQVLYNQRKGGRGRGRGRGRKDQRPSAVKAGPVESTISRQVPPQPLHSDLSSSTVNEDYWLSLDNATSNFVSHLPSTSDIPNSHNIVGDINKDKLVRMLKRLPVEDRLKMPRHVIEAVHGKIEDNKSGTVNQESAPLINEGEEDVEEELDSWLDSVIA